MKYRAYFRYDKNVLLPKFKPQLLSGENNNGNLFSMDQYFGPDRGFVYHSIGQENKQILVKLGMPSKVNHIKLLLLDSKPIAYSYAVEVSLDQNEWYKVADYSMYWCRGWQNISFHPHVIQYIRVIGIRSYFDDSNPIFCLVNIQCSFSSQRISFKNHDGIPLIIPGHNVATYANGAILWVSQPNATLFDRRYEFLSGSDKLTTNCIQLDQSKYLYPGIEHSLYLRFINNLSKNI
jgi:BTB/POZ domain-containing protein 9